MTSPEAPSPGASSPPPPSTLPAPAPRRRTRERSAIVVDDVGDVAVRLAARIPRDEVPRVLVSERKRADALLDAAEVSLLSFVDGASTVGSLIDRTGHGASELNAMLCRLERLGVIGF